MRTALVDALCAIVLLGGASGGAQDLPAHAASRAGEPLSSAGSVQRPKNPPETVEQTATGSVVDADGNVVDGAEIGFSGPKRATVWSDADGNFEFSGPPGDYAVTVVAGTRRHSFRVKLDNDRLTPSRLVIDPVK